MKKLVLFLLLLIFPSIILAEEPKVFTDQDLKGYPSHSREIERQGSQMDAEILEDTIDDAESFIYWCEMGTYYQRKVDDAKDKVSKYELELEKAQSKYDTNNFYKKKDAYVSDYDVTSAKSRLEYAINDLEKAEQDLKDLEFIAYQQGIMPGWLRCQR